MVSVEKRAILLDQKICLKCPSGVKKHKKDECPDKSDGEEEESEEKEDEKDGE